MLLFFKHVGKHVNKLPVRQEWWKHKTWLRNYLTEYLRYLLCLPLQLEENPRNMQKCQRFGQCMMKFRTWGYLPSINAISCCCFAIVQFWMGLTEFSLCSLTLFAGKNSLLVLTAAFIKKKTKKQLNITLICGLVSMGYFTKRDSQFTWRTSIQTFLILIKNKDKFCSVEWSPVAAVLKGLKCR